MSQDEIKNEIQKQKQAIKSTLNYSTASKNDSYKLINDFDDEEHNSFADNINAINTININIKTSNKINKKHDLNDNLIYDSNSKEIEELNKEIKDLDLISGHDTSNLSTINEQHSEQNEHDSSVRENENMEDLKSQILNSINE